MFIDRQRILYNLRDEAKGVLGLWFGERRAERSHSVWSYPKSRHLRARHSCPLMTQSGYVSRDVLETTKNVTGQQH